MGRFINPKNVLKVVAAVVFVLVFFTGLTSFYTLISPDSSVFEVEKDVDLNGNTLTGLSSPQDRLDAVHKKYVDVRLETLNQDIGGSGGIGLSDVLRIGNNAGNYSINMSGNNITDCNLINGQDCDNLVQNVSNISSSTPGLPEVQEVNNSINQSISLAGNQPIEIGTQLITGDEDSITIGRNAETTKKTVAIGASAKANYEDALAIGQGASATDFDSLAIGQGATASKNGAFALGKNAEASDSNAFALGTSGTPTIANSTAAVAIGGKAEATGGLSTAIGNDAAASAISSLAIGESASASGDTSFALGTSSSASGSDSVSIGPEVSNSVDNLIKLGDTGFSSPDDVSIPGGFLDMSGNDVKNVGNLDANRSALGSNSFQGLGEGDINVSTIYRDAAVSKSPIVSCSAGEGWCEFSLPKEKDKYFIKHDANWSVEKLTGSGGKVIKEKNWEKKVHEKVWDKIGEFQEAAVDSYYRRKAEEKGLGYIYNESMGEVVYDAELGCEAKAEWYYFENGECKVNQYLNVTQNPDYKYYKWDWETESAYLDEEEKWTSKGREYKWNESSEEGYIDEEIQEEIEKEQKISSCKEDRSTVWHEKQAECVQASTVS